MLAEECDRFWRAHVLTGTPPEIVGQSVTDYVRERFKVAGEGMREATADETAWIAQYARLKDVAKKLEDEMKPLATAMQLAIGNDKGLQSEAGRAIWTNVKGKTVTDWKAIALAAGAAEGLINAHTTIGNGYRMFKVTPAAGGAE